jgi:AmiR/NasT family two-component response regulator
MAIIEDRSLVDCEDELLGLKKKLESLPVIEQAKGILMAREGCDADEAFGMLRRASQRENVKLREIATRIVTNASTPPRWFAPDGDGNGRNAGVAAP